MVKGRRVLSLAIALVMLLSASASVIFAVHGDGSAVEEATYVFDNTYANLTSAEDVNESILKDKDSGSNAPAKEIVKLEGNNALKLSCSGWSYYSLMQNIPTDAVDSPEYIALRVDYNLTNWDMQFSETADTELSVSFTELHKISSATLVNAYSLSAKDVTELPNEFNGWIVVNMSNGFTRSGGSGNFGTDSGAFDYEYFKGLYIRSHEAFDHFTYGGAAVATTYEEMMKFILSYEKSASFGSVVVSDTVNSLTEIGNVPGDVITDAYGSPTISLLEDSLDGRKAINIKKENDYIHTIIVSSFSESPVNANVIAFRLKYSGTKKLTSIDIFENNNAERYQLPLNNNKLALISAADASVTVGQNIPDEFDGWVVCAVDDLVPFTTATGDGVPELEKITHIFLATDGAATNDITYSTIAAARVYTDVLNYVKGSLNLPTALYAFDGTYADLDAIEDVDTTILKDKDSGSNAPEKELVQLDGKNALKLSCNTGWSYFSLAQNMPLNTVKDAKFIALRVDYSMKNWDMQLSETEDTSVSISQTELHKISAATIVSAVDLSEENVTALPNVFNGWIVIDMTTGLPYSGGSGVHGQQNTFDYEYFKYLYIRSHESFDHFTFGGAALATSYDDMLDYIKSVTIVLSADVNISDTVHNLTELGEVGGTVLKDVYGDPTITLLDSANGLDCNKAIKIVKDDGYCHNMISTKFEINGVAPTVVAFRLKYKTTKQLMDLQIFEGSERYCLPLNDGILTLINAADATVQTDQDLPLEFNGWVVCNISDLAPFDAATADAEFNYESTTYVFISTNNESENEILYGGLAVASSVDHIKAVAELYKDYNQPENGDSEEDSADKVDLSVSNTVYDLKELGEKGGEVLSDINGTPDISLEAGALDSKQAIKLTEEDFYFHAKLATTFKVSNVNANVVAIRIKYTGSKQMTNLDLFEDDFKERYRLPANSNKLTLIKATDASVKTEQNLPLAFNGWVVCNISDLEIVKEDNGKFEPKKITHAFIATDSLSTNEILYGTVALASSTDKIVELAKGFTEYNKVEVSASAMENAVNIQDFEKLGVNDDTDTIINNGYISGVTTSDGMHLVQLSTADGDIERGKSLLLLPASSYTDSFIKVNIPADADVSAAEGISIRIKTPEVTGDSTTLKVRFLIQEANNEVFTYNHQGYSKELGNATTVHLTDARTLKTTNVELTTGPKEESYYANFIPAGFDGWVTIPWSYFTYHQSFIRYYKNGVIDPANIASIAIEIETQSLMQNYYIDDLMLVEDIDKFLTTVGPAVTYGAMGGSSEDDEYFEQDYIIPDLPEDTDKDTPIVDNTPTDTDDGEDSFPTVTVIIIAAAVLVLGGIVAGSIILVKKKKKLT